VRRRKHPASRTASDSRDEYATPVPTQQREASTIITTLHAPNWHILSTRPLPSPTLTYGNLSHRGPGEGYIAVFCIKHTLLPFHCPRDRATNGSPSQPPGGRHVLTMPVFLFFSLFFSPLPGHPLPCPLPRAPNANSVLCPVVHDRPLCYRLPTPIGAVAQGCGGVVRHEVRMSQYNTCCTLYATKALARLSEKTGFPFLLTDKLHTNG